MTHGAGLDTLCDLTCTHPEASLDTSEARSERSLLGARLQGDKAVETQLGVATFTNLQVDVMATHYRISFAVAQPPGLRHLRPAKSAYFAVSVGRPAQLVIERQGGGATPGYPMSLPPIVSAADRGGNPVPQAFNISAHLLQGNVSLQHTVRAGRLALAPAGTAIFSSLTLTRAGDGMVLRFELLRADGRPWHAIAPAFSYPPFRVLPGAAHALHVDRQPSGAVTWGALAVAPLVSVHDAGGNRVAQGPHHLFASLVLPRALSGQERLFNASLPYPYLSQHAAPPASPGAWPQRAARAGWQDTTNASVQADATGQASFDGLRIFGPRGARGLVLRFRHCWDAEQAACWSSLTVDSHAFDLAGLPATLTFLPPFNAADHPSDQPAPASPASASWVLDPDQWSSHTGLSSMSIGLVDADGIIVGGGRGNITASLCFLTSSAQEFYCRGEELDELLFEGGVGQDGQMERPVRRQGPLALLISPPALLSTWHCKPTLAL